jgi:outer membrane lipoprotein-sorting protein
VIRLFLILLAASISHAESLDAILARMDAAAKEFKSMSAKMKREEYNALLRESTERTGEMVLKRTKNGVAGVVRFGEPDPQVIHVDSHEARIYYPKANTVNIYNIAKYSKSVNQLILLGFGTSGAELKSEYTVRATGVESIDSVSATHLELIPKSEEVRKLFPQIELWIRETKSYPVQEKVVESSKNYTVVKYSAIEVNPHLSDSEFELKLPPGVRVVKP